MPTPNQARATARKKKRRAERAATAREEAARRGITVQELRKIRYAEVQRIIAEQRAKPPTRSVSYGRRYR